MRRFGFNLILGVAWCMLWGSFSSWNFAGGLLVGALIINGYARVTGQSSYVMKILNLLRFAAYFLWILAKTKLQIAREVVTPGWSQTPRILRYPVGHLDDVHVTTLSNAITLTPGTLAVDISPDGQYLYLHCMYAESREQQIADLDELADRLNRWVFS